MPTLTSFGPNEFLIGRTRVDPNDWPCEFRLKLLGAYCWLSKVYYYKKIFQKFINKFINNSIR